MADPVPQRYQSAIHDWGREPTGSRQPSAPHLFDDTLRDGLQNPSVVDPGLQAKCALMEHMARVGVTSVGIGMPSASSRQFGECLELCRFAEGRDLGVTPVCAARTLPGDVEVALRLCSEAPGAIELHVFLGTSPIRGIVEGWSRQLLTERTAAAVRQAARVGVSVAFVAEDATRSDPDTLSEVFRAAIGEGAKRLCLCDTVGAATPRGTRRIVEHTQRVIESTGARLGIDWHGHNDRGLALANSLAAWEAGADRLHGTVLGIGERVGNTAIELLVLNLYLAGCVGHRAARELIPYTEQAAALLDWPIPPNYPLVGADAFRTAAGVHAAAIRKAEERQEPWLAERVYSAVSAAEFGRAQEVCIGHGSGTSNVLWWLKRHGYPSDPRTVARILTEAKAARRLLDDATLHRLAQPTDGTA